MAELPSTTLNFPTQRCANPRVMPYLRNGYRVRFRSARFASKRRRVSSRGDDELPAGGCGGIGLAGLRPLACFFVILIGFVGSTVKGALLLSVARSGACRLLGQHDCDDSASIRTRPSPRQTLRGVIECSNRPRRIP